MRYSVVVGNPPYITAKDAALREEYRRLYPRSASKQYSLAAPFTERFFDLAREGGFVGMLTANSFMKREFGKRLIEDYLRRVRLLSGGSNRRRLSHLTRRRRVLGAGSGSGILPS